MWKYLLVMCVSSTLFNLIKAGPSSPPTKGEVWPNPHQEKKETTYYNLDLSKFKIKVTSNNCTLLENAVSRFESVLNDTRRLARHQQRDKSVVSEGLQGALQDLQIELTQPCEQYPSLNMEESYNLTVAANSKLKSASIWGVMRGLETFTHLLYLTDDYKEVLINATEIVDYPAYAHRGLLIDTSRHYLSVESILKTLDALAINKMNVLHWHITDDPSFPYESEKFPELSKQGAYHPSMVYAKADIEKIVNYATDRGIRVVPEFDMPGHTSSWAVSHPEIFDDGCSGTMNPTKNQTYQFLQELFQEVKQRFPDQYVHLGGDEVQYNCWKDNKEIKEYMKKYNISDAKDLLALFVKNVTTLLTPKKTIVWQEVFTAAPETAPLSKDALVQVWLSDDVLIKAVEAGHRALYSVNGVWYLDTYINNVFKTMYNVNPRSLVKNETLKQNVVGGEACMWGEMVDDRNLISKVWPRASAVAEVLWSAPGKDFSYEVSRRIEEHTCRMVRRGILAEPATGPGFCVV